MRYVMFSLPGEAAPRLGVLQNDSVLDVRTLAGEWPGGIPSTLLALIQRGPDAWQRMREGAAQPGDAARHALASIRWHAPVPRPLKNIVCLGMNYAEHVREAAGARGREAKLPTVPVFFTKAPTSVTGPYDDVPVDPAVTQQVDWEVELGFIIGKTGRNIAAADALGHVFGYTVINDLSARELQWQHMQFYKGKSLDGFCPMGPVVVTADEFGDPHSKRLTTRVNGVTKQDSITGDMIFKIDATIEWLSKGLTIEAGDVVATGTPQGVGMGRTPPEYLQAGDVVETEVEGIGMLRNRIVGIRD
jgi:2-keto-4-pentenoate hydratase/2-oxohepta-3-ene-1,7-dioic acid hydratase in catechol pathway